MYKEIKGVWERDGVNKRLGGDIIDGNRKESKYIFKEL